MDHEPWTHRFLSANNCRFHVVEIGDGPIVLLLHGFPQSWWAWRHQLPALAAAGYHAVAIDLRGYGASDKPPRGYDPFTLAADVAGLVAELGSEAVTLVGRGWGGYVAWAAAAAYPDQVSALCAVGAPHPDELLRSPARLVTHASFAHLLTMQIPWFPERQMMRSDYVGRHLRGWSAAGSSFPTEAEAARYREAFARWPSPHCALEYHRWLMRSRCRADGRAFAKSMRQPILADVLQVNGADDPAVHLVAVERSSRHVTGCYEEAVVAEAGHFVPEEAPDAFTGILLDWLSRR